MTKKPAFSLMEVMVILLILAVTLAATAPMISKKMSRNVGTAEEPWRFSGTNESVSFNGNNRDNATVFIGTDRLREYYGLGNVMNIDGQNTPLYIKALDNNNRSIAAIIGNVLNDRHNDNDSPEPLIAGYFGMKHDDNPPLFLQHLSFPFISGRIPQDGDESIILGNDNAFEGAHTGVVMTGYDGSINDHRFAQTSRTSTNVTYMGAANGVSNVQNAVVIGRDIANAWAFAGRLDDTVILSTVVPLDYIAIWVPQSTDQDGNTIPGHFEFTDQLIPGVNTRYYNIVASSLDDDDVSIVDSVTTIGGANMSYGNGHTLIGHASRCGSAMVSQPNVMAGDSSFNSVSIGHISQANGPESVSIGNNNFAGLQQILARNNSAFTQQDSSSRAIAIGNVAQAFAPGSIALGSHVTVVGNGYNPLGGNNYDDAAGSIVIGRGSQVIGDSAGSIVIGNSAESTAPRAIAIVGRPEGVHPSGPVNVVTGKDSIIIGNCTRSHHDNSVAIGPVSRLFVGAETDAHSQIMLGRSLHKVVIPGTLDVNNIKLSDTAKQLIQDDAVIMNLLSGGMSDIRLKNVGEKFTSGLDEINKLEFFNYTYKNDKDKKPHVGVMAQDLQKVFPISVTEGSDGYLRIRTDEMFYAALNAIKELNRKIIALASEVKEFFSRVDKLDIRVAQHQTALDKLKTESAEIGARLARLEEE